MINASGSCESCSTESLANLCANYAECRVMEVKSVYWTACCCVWQVLPPGERLRSWVFMCWFFDAEKASFADLNLSSSSMFKVTSNWKNLTVKGKEDLKYGLLSMLLACKQTGSNNQGCCYLESWQSFTGSSGFGYINVHYWDLSFTRYSHKCL